MLRRCYRSFFSFLHMCAALKPHTYGIPLRREESECINALTSPAGHTDRPLDGWRCPRDVHANLDPRNVALGNIGAMVNIAHATYCPNQRCWAPHC